jgi:P27 family predicted phage terminase small subunit
MKESAPKHLKAATRKWFSNVVESYELEEHHHRLLTLAAEAWDRASEARKAIDDHGLTYTDRFNAPRLRPEVAVERDSRIAFARLLRELGLDEAGTPSTSPAMSPIRSNSRGR